jgi:basic membrane protein A
LPTATRRRFISALAGFAFAPAAVLLLSGCPNTARDGGTANNAPATSGNQTGTTNANEATAPTVGWKIKAGLVTDTGGIGDKSFNAAANAGLQRADQELGAEVKITESRQAADYVGNLSRFAQNGYDVVFAVGFLMQDALKQVAPRFPNVKFAIVDGDAPDLPNCVSLKFREEEGSFLAGALAGAVTKTNKIGFVGGMEVPLIKKFEAGYKAGAKTTNPKITFVDGYAGTWTDPQKGQELAISQMGAGADIIYHAAGQTGLGVITAAKNRGEGYYAIGVDRDQDDIAPGRVLTSMIKRVDNAVFDVCQAVAQNKFAPGARVFGLKDEGVGLSEMKYTKDKVPAQTLARVDALKQQIIAGTLKPPVTLDEMAAFEPPK